MDQPPTQMLPSVVPKERESSEELMLQSNSLAKRVAKCPKDRKLETLVDITYGYLNQEWKLILIF
jgi:hypothetical protein